MRIYPTPLCRALLGSTLALAALTPAAAASAPHAEWGEGQAVTGSHSLASRRIYTVLHNFAGPTGDGRYSFAEVTPDRSGKIYGTTDSGGAYGAGVLFEVAPGGTESVVHNFGGAGDGITPEGAATIDAGGNMYGTTAFGGASNDGTIWELAADGTYTVPHCFTCDEGDYLRGRLIEDKAGNLYGTARYGGANDDGTVFQCCPKGQLTAPCRDDAAARFALQTTIRPTCRKRYTTSRNSFGCTMRIVPSAHARVVRAPVTCVLRA
ncbi:MAG TPA: choice-of-anchor tandem repeat GloVer-containing protein [Rhizomicrobium sp.]|nr:choice-of-anchor tandem repeat GloVer-containing protein [Rhizomicrobium sp.]